MNTEEIMQQINDLQGMTNFKDFCHRLVTAAMNMATQHVTYVPLPNLIFAAAPGCGITLHIRLLANLLKSLRLLQFTGEEEYFEWALADDDKAFDRFLRRVKQAGGFYGQFHGVIGLNIGEMLEEQEQLQPMERLMEYMDARQGKIVFILIVPEDTPKHILAQLLGRFASISPVELVRMPFPQEEVREYIAQQLIRRGFSVSEEARAALRNAVAQLSTSEEFEGYQTLQNLTEEIVWNKISRHEMSDTEISAEDVSFILAQDGYTSRLKAYARRTNHRKLGFGAASEE